VTLALHLPGPTPFQEADWLQGLAQSGDAGAAAQLGLAYRDGRYSLAPDVEASRYWLGRATAGGDPYAAQLLAGTRPPPPVGGDGLATLAGRLASPTLETAAVVSDLLRRADPAAGFADALRQRAAAGDGVAAYQLAMRYHDGSWGVRRDLAQSRQWLLRAAQAGNPVAVKTLARMSRAGEPETTTGAQPLPPTHNGTRSP
jgi:TPR repeat protein